MAGYKPKDKIYRLKFTDPDLDGLEVDTTSASLGDILRMQELAQVSSENGDTKSTRDMLQTFSHVIKAWNILDDDDQPVPPTFEGLCSLSDELATAIFQAWMTKVAGVSAPLADGSPSGETSLEASLPMETLSPSPVS